MAFLDSISSIYCQSNVLCHARTKKWGVNAEKWAFRKRRWNTMICAHKRKSVISSTREKHQNVTEDRMHRLCSGKEKWLTPALFKDDLVQWTLVEQENQSESPKQNKTYE